MVVYIILVEYEMRSCWLFQLLMKAVFHRTISSGVQRITSNNWRKQNESTDT